MNKVKNYECRSTKELSLSRIMFEVKSFFRKNNDFIPISEFTAEISDPNYIEGAIEISKWGNKVLSIEDFDYVDQLWCYFVEGIEKVSKGMEFDTYLPDRPTLISFKPSLASQKVVITVGKDSKNFISVEYDEFLNVMIFKAKEFFWHMKRLLPNSQDTYAQIEKDLETVEKNLLK